MQSALFNLFCRFHKILNFVAVLTITVSDLEHKPFTSINKETKKQMTLGVNLLSE